MKIKVTLHIILLVSLLTINFNKSLAQMSVGFKFGALAAKTSYGDKNYTDEFDLGISPGISIGSVYGFDVGKKFGLHTELNLSVKGSKTKRMGADHIKNKINNFYLDLPLLLKLDAGGKTKNWFILFGPTISYWLAGKGHIRGSELDEYNVSQFDYTLYFNEDNAIANDGVYVPSSNRILYSLTFGIGHSIVTRQGQEFTIDLRYDMGHTHFSDSRESRLLDLATFQNNFQGNHQVLSLSVIYLFDLKTLRRNLAK